MANEPDDKTIDDGGPAYPLLRPASATRKYYVPGMSLRMWLAGQNHAAILGNDSLHNHDPQEMSELALRHADALIAENAQGSENDEV